MVLQATKRWAPFWSGQRVVVKSDSEVAAAIVNKGTTPCPIMMDWLWELFWLSEYYAIHLTVEHIPGSANVIADSISRLDEICHRHALCAWLSLPLLKICFLIYHLCHLLSSDPDDQSRLDMEVLKFRKQAYATSTKASSKSQLRAYMYLTFCVYYGYQPLPASTITLSRYAAFLARSASSIPAYLNIVRILHLEHGLGDPTKNNFHLATMRGIHRCKGCTVSQKQPMTPAMLLAIKSHLNLADPVHATFWAVYLRGFVGLLRKANMLLKGVAKFYPLKHLRRSDIVFYPGWAIVINCWSKTIQFSQCLLTVLLPLIPGHPLCPYSALQHAFKLVPATLSGPAFVLPAPSSRGLILFTCAKFNSLLKSVVSAAGLDPSRISGHSLRSGGATLAFQVIIVIIKPLFKEGSTK